MAKKKKRTDPTLEQLDRMLRHVGFEIKRFRRTVPLWMAPQHDEYVSAMIRESCLIHMRLLLDFFYPRKGWEHSIFKDVFVTDYFPKSNWSAAQKKCFDMPQWVLNYRNQLDTRLAHLTMERFNFEAKPVWEPEAHFDHLEEVIRCFVDSLTPEQTKLFDQARS